MKNKSIISKKIKSIGKSIGFDDVRITSPDLDREKMFLSRWLHLDNCGEMDYLSKHGLKRASINQIHESTISIICVSKNYLTKPINNAIDNLNDSERGNISLYALNKDYHKLMRKELKIFADQIEQLLISNNKLQNNQFKPRVFVDSAPIMEKSFAKKSGIGFMGKHTNIINRQIGSFFFLGEIAINLELEKDIPTDELQGNCGSCRKCIDICPTQAIIAPYQLDATLCISYLTIEYSGIINDELKTKIGNRVFGCDDCQLCCPWNKYAKVCSNDSFVIRESLKNNRLLNLFTWNEETFLENTLSSPIRRIGYISFKRNVAIGLGNYLRKITKEPINNLEPKEINKIKLALVEAKLDFNNQQKKTYSDNISALIDAIDWALNFK